MTVAKIDLRPTTSTLEAMVSRTREYLPTDVNTQLLQTM